MTDHTASPMSDPLTEEAQKPVMHDYPKRGARPLKRLDEKENTDEQQ